MSKCGSIRAPNQSCHHSKKTRHCLVSTINPFSYAILYSSQWDLLLHDREIAQCIYPYLHGDILPGKLLKIEQASEKSSCKSGIFLCHIVRPLTQPNCLEIEHGLFSQAKWNSPRAFIWYVDGFCIHFCRSPGRKRGKSSCILCYQESHSSTFIYMVLMLPDKSPRVFCITKKAIHPIFIEQAIHMSPCKTGLRGIFIWDTAYSIVIQWSIGSYFIKSQWKCLMYRTAQYPLTQLHTISHKIVRSEDSQPCPSKRAL